MKPACQAKPNAMAGRRAAEGGANAVSSPFSAHAKFPACRVSKG